MHALGKLEREIISLSFFVGRCDRLQVLAFYIGLNRSSPSNMARPGVLLRALRSGLYRPAYPNRANLLTQGAEK